MAARVEEEADRAKWDSALAHAITLHSDAVFIVDWLRGQAEYHLQWPAPADTWEPTAGPDPRTQFGQGRLSSAVMMRLTTSSRTFSLGVSKGPTCMCTSSCTMVHSMSSLRSAPLRL